MNILQGIGIAAAFIVGATGGAVVYKKWFEEANDEKVREGIRNAQERRSA